MNSRTTSRSIMLAAIAIVALLGASAAQLRSLQASDAPVAAAPADKWLAGLTASHKQFFDTPAPAGGVPLVHLLNYYDTYNKAYNVKDTDIDAVLGFYGATTFYGVSDAAWAKYRIGEFLETNDLATGKPAVVNPWRTAPIIMGITFANASIEALQKRGATFILCNNALTVFATLLAAKRGLDASVVYQDLKANILPNVELVPGMVVAIEQAQRAGATYYRQ